MTGGTSMIRQSSLFQTGPPLPTFRDLKEDEETRIDFDVSLSD
jgi:hypothetical protein